jgi:hypothetical protein
VDRLVFFAGIASCAGGVFLFLYQGITYLMHNVWTPYTVYFLMDFGPAALKEKVDMSPGILSAMEGCPLFVALLVLGMLLLLVGSRLSARYLN